MDVVQVQCAIDDPEAADRLIAALLDERLVACGQRLGPMVSRYWWRGVQEQTEEWLVLVKTRAALSQQVVEAIVARHPYETPEVIVLPAVSGAPGYLAWIDRVTTAPGS